MKRVLFFILLLQFIFAENNITSLTENVKNTILELVKPQTDEPTLNTNNTTIQETIKEKKEEDRKKRAELELEKEEAQKIEQERIRKEQVLAKKKQQLIEMEALRKHINSLENKKKLIDEELSKDNIWANRYLPYETYQQLLMKQQEYNEEIKEYDEKENLSIQEQIKLKKLKDEYKITEAKLSQLSEYKKEPFSELIKIDDLEKEPTITNPWDIITAMSYKQHMNTLKDEYDTRYKSLKKAVEKLREKSMLLKELTLITTNKNYSKELVVTEKKLKYFEEKLEVFGTTIAAFSQQVSQHNLHMDEGIEKEIKKSMRTGIIIVLLLVFFLFIKFLINKYMSENDLFYGINKVANFLFIFLILMILLFTYLENVKALMTFVSFASAGIAIALKDWFMSLLGWVVILVSGSIHVGDRVKFVKDGVEYVGDIVDISVLRMTLHEDVTLTTIYSNRRTGRMIFIPNNYIFTDMIANYSHAGLKTVWDGIDFFITFDSNIAKAQHIAKEVTRKYSKGYTDMTRKQLNMLRSKYSMRNTAVEPRIFGFFDTYGVRISAWYLTNAYATLTLRSTISMEILSRLHEEDDIFLALPSQSLYMDKPAPRPPLEEGEEPTAEHRVN